ncbi:MAG: hypothetical protein FWG38_02980 [Defluviitaleaceae bacterium]|nr:hypothetical protein [Defluviitaleaceae bacterium]
MKNIIIAGSARAGKSTLARKINAELGHFVIGLDKLVATFQEAYPQLNIRLNWNRQKTTANLAPFLGHFLGMFASPSGRGLLPYSHGVVEGNRFVLEGAYFDCEKILPMLNMYGMKTLAENFALIGLVQNQKTVDDFVSDFKQYDTEDDWTYGFSDEDLREIAKDQLAFGRQMSNELAKHGFTIYDTSAARGQVLDQIVADIKML